MVVVLTLELETGVLPGAGAALFLALGKDVGKYSAAEIAMVRICGDACSDAKFRFLLMLGSRMGFSIAGLTKDGHLQI